MSPPSFTPSLNLTIFTLLSILILIFSILVVEHKSLVYAAFFLGFVGLMNAAFFSILGFAFIALFHIAVYVGAAVIFILFAVTMFREVPSVEAPVKALALTIIPLVVIAFSLSFSIYRGRSLAAIDAPYKILAHLFVEKYWFPFLVAALALVTTLIEAITLARREVEA
ncbi:MAG: NADH-quinone oxidoreductase subunit J [Candidatus Geothermarchaeales archaeon]